MHYLFGILRRYLFLINDWNFQFLFCFYYLTFKVYFKNSKNYKFKK
jgi:hypothetical protein